MWIINSLSVFVILHDALKMLALVHTCFCAKSSKSSKDLNNINFYRSQDKKKIMDFIFQAKRSAIYVHYLI